MTPIGFRCPVCSKVNSAADLISKQAFFPNGENELRDYHIQFEDCQCVIGVIDGSEFALESTPYKFLGRLTIYE